MNTFIGIDLGSTTTKAVLLDEQGQVLGRGITNSRSNYDLAAKVARTEAYVTARFGLLRREVERAAGPAMLARLIAGFRAEQTLAQLSRLDAHLHEDVDRSVPADRRDAVHEAVTRILDAMRAEEEAYFLTLDPPPRSDFFRNLASSAWLRLAEAAASAGGPSFDLMAALFDKCIIKVENEPMELGFHRHIDAAAARACRLVDAAGGRGVALTEALTGGVARARDVPLDEIGAVGTGYGRARLPFPKEQIRSEILCHGLGAHAMFPDTRTVLDIGGQDTKAIQVDAAGIVTSFQMNDRCAAGCGRYLGYIADEMSIGLHELGPMANQSQRPARINSTCTVFAGAELRERLSLGERREDILLGLHRAVILRAMSLLARSGGVFDAFTFTGGVARNEAAVGALRRLVQENYGARTLHISADSIYTGALGASLFALRAETERSQPTTPDARDETMHATNNEL